ncbi:hypothetical protein J4Q44_G00387230, partial [Coregonus suidteri]
VGTVAADFLLRRGGERKSNVKTHPSGLVDGSHALVEGAQGVCVGTPRRDPPPGELERPPQHCCAVRTDSGSVSLPPPAPVDQGMKLQTKRPTMQRVSSGSV